ncbi:DUF4372 domain-containing protein [Maribacter antarcticus]|uniref:DUF4372 domain-containing protein n=1 Tax=Maribacter antarcticus TaxID=505250 RepID=UPI0029345FB3|nr:DUF4372 domain-containing protein [Maribacter antarcticus]
MVQDKKHLYLIINITLFSQIIYILDSSKFKKLVNLGKTDKHQKGFDSCSHLVSMFLCQFAKSPIKIYIKLPKQVQKLGAL